MNFCAVTVVRDEERRSISFERKDSTNHEGDT